MKNIMLIAAAISSLSLWAMQGQPLGNFQLITVSLNNKSFVIARCNTLTGEGWYRIGGKWIRAVEENPVGKSAYICAGQAFGENGWLFVRMDLNGGRMWTLQGEIWRIVLE